ncbi:MAG TPA: glycoside hydrolase family 88 protein [Tepidisphaeraceae bacterium]|nr:glycoside hydrolase family 88 protein [Tepidisphaeraceae bacterium]
MQVWLSQAFASALVLVLMAGCQQHGVSSDSSDTKSVHFQSWPEGKSPKEIGNRVGQRFIESPHLNEKPERAGKANNHIIYPEVCTWYGALTFAKVTDNKALRRQLIQRFEALFGELRHYVPVPDHVDNTVFAAVPLELYMQTNDPRYLAMGKEMADKQWGVPFGRGATTQALEYHNKGLTWQTRMWIDDMYMITAAQAQAYRATGDRKYIDRAAREMVVYLDELQQDNGLFYHAPDVPFFWGRGDGWVAAGMAELLRSLPGDNPHRPRIMKGYKLMMAALLKHQDENGMWHQLIDDPQSWPETSCTGMFAFAFITGVKNGWLEADTYGPAARKAWLALTGYLEPNGDLREVCQGTNKKNDRQYYLDRKRITGDMHGQAPMLWCATALLREPDRSPSWGG